MVVDNKILTEITETLGRLDERTIQIQMAVTGRDGDGGLAKDVKDLQASKNRLWGVGAATVFFSSLVEYFIHKK